MAIGLYKQRALDWQAQAEERQYEASIRAREQAERRLARERRQAMLAELDQVFAEQRRRMAVDQSARLHRITAARKEAQARVEDVTVERRGYTFGGIPSGGLGQEAGYGE